MKFKLEIECGEKTCASEPGKFCSQMSSKKYGTIPWCSFFDVELFEKDGWIQRCEDCMNKAEQS